MSELPELNLEAAEKMWRAYLSARSIAPEDAPGYVVECYGDSAELADELLHEVMYGTKRATSSLAKEYRQHGETEPKAGTTGWYATARENRGSSSAWFLCSAPASSTYPPSSPPPRAKGTSRWNIGAVHKEFWTRTQAEIDCNWTPEQTTQPGEELLLERDEICWPPEFADAPSP